MKKNLNLIVLVLILLMCSVMVSSFLPVPEKFYGTVKIGDSDVDAGTSIIAKIDGAIWGSVTIVEPGKYGDPNKVFYLEVSSPEDGKLITFYVGCAEVGTAIFSGGQITELNLQLDAETAYCGDGVCNGDEEDGICNNCTNLDNTCTLDCSEEVESFADHIVFSEIHITGGYVELYNPTYWEVDLTDWKILTSHVVGSDVVFPEGSIIQPYSYFLIAPPTWESGSKPNPEWPDADYGHDVIMINNVELELIDAEEEHVDSIAWRLYNQDFETIEGSPIDYFNARYANASFERKSSLTHDGEEGNALDTDDNGRDFYIKIVPEPQSSVSASEQSPLSQPDIRITEVMFEPSAEQFGNYNEWVEIYNNDNHAVDLSAWKLNGVNFDDFTLSPGQYLVIAEKLIDETAGESFEGYWGNNNGVWDEQDGFNAVDSDILSLNDGEDIVLTDSYEEVIGSFTIDASLGGEANGYSLEMYNFETDVWDESDLEDGTPGEVNSIFDDDLPVINSFELPDDYVQNDTEVTVTAEVSDYNLYSVELSLSDSTETVDDLVVGEMINTQGDTYELNTSLLAEYDTVVICGLDYANNEYCSTVTYTIDDAAPQITINLPTTQEYNAKEIELNVTSDEIVTCDYSLNSGSTIQLFDLGLQGNVTITATEEAPNYSNIIQLFCKDKADNRNDTQTVTFTVNTNTAPVLNFSNVTFDEDVEHSIFDLEFLDDAEDEDANITLEVSVTENITINISEITELGREITFTANENWHGTEQVTFTATDSRGSTDEQTISVIVTSVNDAPVLDTINNSEVVQGSLIDFTVSATDVDEDDLLYFDDFDFGTLDENTGQFLWTPTNNDVGSHTVEFRVNDGTVNTTQTITILVTDLNEAPVLSSVLGQTVDEDSELSFTINADDADLLNSDVLTYSSNLSDLTITKQSNQSQAVVTWTPDNDDVGIYNVEFTVKDNAGLNDTKTTTITVNNVNDIPVLTIGQQIIQESSSKTIDLTQNTTDIDPGENTFTYEVVEQDETKATCTLDETDNKMLTIQAIATSGAITSCDINVTDNSGGSEIYTVNIIVQDVDQPPVFEGTISNITDLAEDTSRLSVDLDDYFSDPDSTITYSASDVEGISFLISGTGVVTINPDDNFFGTRTVTFTATSNSQSVNSNEVTITVINDMLDTPVISDQLPSESRIVIGEDKTQQFSITAEDPDVEEVSINWYVGDELKSSEQTFTFDSVLFNPDTYIVKVKVNDSALHFAEHTWTVIVSEVPVADDFDLNFNVSQGADKATNVEIASETTEAKIDFGDQEIDLSDIFDIDNNIKIQENLIAINTEVLATLNKPATITMISSSLDTPMIYYNDGFTTESDDINEVCTFCKLVSYSKDTGILVFTVEHFTSFTAREQSLAYGMTLSPGAIVFDEDRGVEQIKELVITNTGLQILEDVELSLSTVPNKEFTMKLESGSSYETSIPKFNIAVEGSQKVLVKNLIPNTATSSRITLGDINISSKYLDNQVVKVYQQSPSKLKIVNVEIDDGDDDYSVSDGGIIDEIEPDSRLQFDVELENLYIDDDNEDHEIKSIEIEVIIKSILDEGDDDLDEDTRSFTLDPAEIDSETLNFDIPLEVNEKSTGYKVKIEAEGKDRLGIKHKDEWDLTLYIEKESHDIKIVKSKLEKSELLCGEKSTYLDVTIENHGSEDEKDVVIEVSNSELNLNEEYTSIPKLESDVFDDDFEFAHSFYIGVPENADAKKYPISVIVYYDDNDESDKKTVDLEVIGCEEKTSVVKEQQKVKPKVELDKEFTVAQAQVYQQYEQKSVKKDEGLSESWETTLLICGGIILLGVIIFMFMALSVIGKRKRKY